MFSQKTLSQVNVEGKTVLVRTDFNVPIKNQEVQSDFRIQATLPTLQYLLNHHAGRIVLISHLGRPNGQVDPSLSLAPVSRVLSKLINRPVIFIPEAVGGSVKKTIQSAPLGSVILLENLRFYQGEEANSPDFANRIVKETAADLFVQDGFAVIHRAHASTTQIPKLLPTVAGFLLENEVTNLTKSFTSPNHPLLIIIGGAKIADKQPLIDRFLPIADHIVVAGKIAADGFQSDNPKIYIAKDFRLDSAGNKLDIGDQSLSEILALIQQSRTIVWNGTVGKTETAPFDTSSKAIAEAIGQKSSEFNQTIILGGDTSSFVEKIIRSQEDQKLNFSLISTGGGASLEFLLGLPLPGLEAIN